jgi:hypothetical protein
MEFVLKGVTGIESLKCKFDIKRYKKESPVPSSQAQISIPAATSKEEKKEESKEKIRYRSISPRTKPSEEETKRLLVLIRLNVTLDPSFDDAMEDELTQFMKEGKFWPPWAGPRIEAVNELDQHQHSMLVKPSLLKKDFLNLSNREEVQQMVLKLRLDIVGGLTGYITASIKDVRTLDHLKLVWVGRNIELWDWWDLLYALIIKGHTEDYEKSPDQIIKRLDVAIRDKGFVNQFVPSIFSGGNMDHVTKVIGCLDPILQPGESKKLPSVVYKWLLGNHKVGKDKQTEICIFGRGGLADTLKMQIREIEDLTWLTLKGKLRQFAKFQEGTHRALKESGELDHLKEDVLKEERKRLANLEKKGKEAEDSGKKKINQLETRKEATPFCKICDTKGDHWTFDQEATKVTCPSYLNDPTPFESTVEKKDKIKADLAAWKKIVKDRKDKIAARAAAGGGRGRPSPKKE